jgi:hypothetical protein
MREKGGDRDVLAGGAMRALPIGTTNSGSSGTAKALAVDKLVLEKR